MTSYTLLQLKDERKVRLAFEDQSYCDDKIKVFYYNNKDFYEAVAVIQLQKENVADELFRKTQTIDSEWYKDSGVHLFTKKGARSTNVGDVLIDNVTFEVFIINNYGLVKCVKVVR
jgi:hypothetical protein